MSQKLSLDFAKNRAFSFSHITPTSLLILVAGLVISGLVTLAYQAQNVALNRAQHELTQIQPSKRINATNTNFEAIPPAELKQIADITTDLTTPWDQLLTELEQVEMRDVALLSLEPNKKKQQLILYGQAKNMQVALNYIEALEKLPALSKVFLQKHNVDQIDPFKPVAFTIVAQWS